MIANRLAECPTSLAVMPRFQYHHTSPFHKSGFSLKPQPYRVHSDRLIIRTIGLVWHGMATILIIDDEAPLRALLSTALQSAGYDVVEASTGRAGLALYRQRAVDLVIVDMLMPELNGLEIISEFTREFLGAKVVAISGMGGDESMLNTAKLLGARQTLRKPFGIDQLLGMPVLAATTDKNVLDGLGRRSVGQNLRTISKSIVEEIGLCHAAMRLEWDRD